MSDANKQQVLQYLPLITAIIVVAMSWGVFSQRVANAEDVASKQAARIDVLEKTLVDLRLDVAEINARTANMQDDLAYIKSKV